MTISTGSVRLSVFLRALSLMGYTLEIKKEGKTVVSIRPEDYSPAERDKRKDKYLVSSSLYLVSRGIRN